MHPEIYQRSYVFKSAWKRGLSRVMDACGVAVTRLIRKPSVFSPPHRILLLRLDHLGDVICSLPAIDALTRMSPKLFIAVCVSSASAILLRDTPGIDQIISFDAPWFARRKTSWSQVFRCMKQIRDGHFDASIDFRGDLRHHLITALSNIPVRIGYGSTGGGFLLTREMIWNRQENPVDANLSLLSLLVSVSPDRRPIPVLKWNERLEETEWRSRVIPTGTPYWVIHPDAGTLAKRWAAERYAPLIGELQQRNLGVVIVGSNPSISPAFRQPGVVNLIGKTTLPQLIGLIQGSAGLISTDSGPAHIAAALQKPVFILWSGTASPAQWLPRGNNVSFVQHHVPCAYCGLSRCPVSGHPCLEDLSAEHVLSRMKESMLDHPL